MTDYVFLNSNLYMSQKLESIVVVKL